MSGVLHTSKIHCDVAKYVENMQQRERDREKNVWKGWRVTLSDTKSRDNWSHLKQHKDCNLLLGPWLDLAAHFIIFMSTSQQSNRWTYRDWFAHSRQVTSSVVAGGLRQLIGQNVPPLHPLTLVPQAVHPVAKSISLNLTAQAHTTCKQKYTSWLIHVCVCSYVVFRVKTFKYQ